MHQQAIYWTPRAFSYQILGFTCQNAANLTWVTFLQQWKNSFVLVVRKRRHCVCVDEIGGEREELWVESIEGRDGKFGYILIFYRVFIK